MTKEPKKKDAPAPAVEGEVVTPPKTNPPNDVQSHPDHAVTILDAPLIQSCTDMNEVVKRAEAEVDALRKIKIISLRVTNENDWIDRSGNPYLQIWGTMKIAGIWGISIKDMKHERQDFKDKDGDYYVVITSGKAVFRTREIDEIGTCTSRDEFFGYKDKQMKALEDVVYENILKASATNFHNRVLKKILGLAPTWEDFKEAGLDRAKMKSVANQERKGTPEDQQKQVQIRTWLYEMHGDQHLAKLHEVSAYVTTKDGVAHEGVKAYEELRGIRLTINFEKVEKIYKGWLAEQKKDAGAQPAGSAPKQEPPKKDPPPPAGAGKPAPQGSPAPKDKPVISVTQAKASAMGQVGHIKGCVGDISFAEVGANKTKKTTIELYEDETSDVVLVMTMWGDHREKIHSADTMIFKDVLKSDYNGQVQYKALSVEAGIPFGDRAGQ